LAFGVRIAIAMGTGAIKSVQALAGALEDSHPKEAHWYLAILGTRPENQGQGIASEVLRPVLQRCDRDGCPAYLESSKESNIPFCQRHGFQVTHEIRVPAGPMLWGMQRPPG
jgi:GNAT superfamily N-acetyltransferase